MASSLNSKLVANNSAGTGLVPISENHFVPLRTNLSLPIIIVIGKKWQLFEGPLICFHMDGHDQPTALKQTSIFARASATRTARWRRWQEEAEAIWKEHPNLSRHSVARLVKRRLQLSQHTDSIARRIRK